MKGSKIDFSKFKQGAAASTLKAETPEPPIVETEQPAVKPAEPPKPAAKPKKVNKQKTGDKEVANVQFVFYITASEAKAFRALLDGRPISKYMRKKVVELIGGDSNEI